VKAIEQVAETIVADRVRLGGVVLDLLVQAGVMHTSGDLDRENADCAARHSKAHSPPALDTGVVGAQLDQLAGDGIDHPLAEVGHPVGGALQVVGDPH
jgi:hypothetical protein